MRASFDQVDNMDDMHDVEEIDEPGHGGRGYRQLPTAPAEPRDLTLGMTALLGIFFAVVLVCAVFFGFGYSTGRTLHGSKIPVASTPSAKPAPVLASSPESPSEPAASSVTPYTTPPPVSKPSPYAATLPTQAAADASARTATRASYAPAPPAAPTAANGSTTGAGGMVQIAAVMHQGDAQALAQALRRNGYPAVVRTEPQDSFLHVQVGPFASKEQARAMRARLQADGYNPIMKP